MRQGKLGNEFMDRTGLDMTVQNSGVRYRRNYDVRVERLMAKLGRNLAHANIQYLEDSRKRLWLKGDSSLTIYTHFSNLRPFIDEFGHRNLKRIKQEEIAQFVFDLEASGRYTPFVTQRIKRAIKMFYRYLVNEQFSKFIVVKDIYNELSQEELLSEVDVLRLIEACDNLRDKTILAVLYDGGLRPFELVNINTSDLAIQDNPLHLKIIGKNEFRRTIPLTFSVDWLYRYIASVKRFGDGCLFMGRYGRLTVDAGLQKIVRKAAERARLGKRVYATLFRHSRATYLGRYWNDYQMCNFFGWRIGSRIVRNYVHPSVEDLDRAILKLNCL